MTLYKLSTVLQRDTNKVMGTTLSVLTSQEGWKEIESPSSLHKLVKERGTRVIRGTEKIDTGYDSIVLIYYYCLPD